MHGERVYDGSAFEKVAGYARASRHGALIAVSGTAAIGRDGAPMYPGDSYRQAKAAFEHAIAAVSRLGGTRDSIIRTRLFLTVEADWQRAVDAHRELFAKINPANTTLFVAGFVPPGVLVEVEIDAVLEPDGSVQ